MIGPTVKFFNGVWDEAEKDRNAYMASERNRIVEAKALAGVLGIGAGSLFGGFLLLAIYLIIARIEIHIRNISIRNS